MCELLGAALDAAVARVLGRAVTTFEDQPDIVLVDDEFFHPSRQQPELAMALQVEHNVCVVPVNYAAPGGEWRAGFYLSYDDIDGWEAEHEARGPTPAIAICRALVRRADETAQWAAAAAAQQAQDEAETARREAIRGVAWGRATRARQTRKPWTEFASDEEQRAYALCMDQQLAFIRDLNAKGLA